MPTGNGQANERPGGNTSSSADEAKCGNGSTGVRLAIRVVANDFSDELAGSRTQDRAYPKAH